ncbi:MAG: ABC transporter ATP-binding protein/permease [Gammaproteobacteria bacterium]|jgi:putative ATP-binding cassette transporter
MQPGSEPQYSSPKQKARFDRAFFRDAWHLAKPYFTHSEERWGARGLLLVIMVFTVAQVYVGLRITNWYNAFWNAMQQYDKGAFWHLIGVFTILALVSIVLGVYQTYITQLLDLRWRRWLTQEYLTRYLHGRAYYHMEVFKRGQDNPDQRIADDLSSFSAMTTSLFTGMLNAAANLVAFIGLLWVLSEKLIIPIGGHDQNFPGILVWVALLYSVAGTWLAAKIGNPLIGLNYHQERLQADFRFSLVRLRENSEAVAFYGGEAREKANFMDRFNAVFGNYKRLILRQKAFNWMNSYFGQIAIILPILFPAIAYFAKKVSLGYIMQVGAAFAQVQNSFSYLANSYDSLANWHAVVDRLRGFMNLMEEVESLQSTEHQLRHREDGGIATRGLTLYLPKGQPIIQRLDLDVQAGERLLITGRSGIGKSTLLRALAGLWPFGDGEVALPPRDEMLFLPQKPYLPLGSLRTALLYPRSDLATDDHTIQQALEAVGMGGFAELLGEVQPWSHVLSLGEQQRLAMARVLITRPRWLFMDEASSALDEPTEAQLYRLIVEALPEVAIVSVGHRSTLLAYHTRRLHLLEGGTWEAETLAESASIPGSASPAVATP